MEGFSTEGYEMVDEYRKKLNFWFTIVFLIEVSFKLIGMGLKSKFSALISRLLSRLDESA
jgi:hypothetical protein